MARIIVAGDSWSSTQFTSMPREWQDRNHYPADLSLANRLRSLGHSVYEAATPGSTVCDQLSVLNGLAMQQRNHQWNTSIDWIVLGWTEWTRDSTIQKFRNLRHDQQPSLKHSYADEFAQVRSRVRQQIHSLSSAFPLHRWLHWGGLSTVWLDDLPDDHTVLFRDYTNQVFGDPPRGVHDLFSFAPAGQSAQQQKQWIQRVFPGTPNDVALKMAEDIARLKYGTPPRRHLELYPDSGHLAFKYYDVLAQRIHDHVTNADPIEQPQKPEFFNIFKAQKHFKKKKKS